MNDNSIIDMFFARDERAITFSQEKFGKGCQKIAYNILENSQDAEEVLSDVWLAAWNAIPPERPCFLYAFLAKITRNLSIKKFRSRTALKRSKNTCEICLSELSECIPDASSVEKEVDEKEIAIIIDRFLRTLAPIERIVFIRRYWYIDSIDTIARTFGFGQSKVKMMLLRTRKKLLNELIKEGVDL